ncbi:Uncharacterized protein M6B38_229880 [Iris pallida]|uniref:Uncharacterized protein n=1 Tax=Iris pallida TaxID=29817 RepID=A0AAX6DSA5_IRIPA|nr:Uncharacterized protein M6B38_229880 [Iris pallida]
MGTYLQQYDKDYMRMAMLKQEETFRHQVHELHRLYQVQKVLMNDMEAEKRQRNSSNSRNKIERWNTGDHKTSSHQPCHEYSCQDKRRPCLALDLELPAGEHVGKDDRDVMLDVDDEEECGLELTLATGCRSRRKKENSVTSDSGASISSSSTESGTRVKLNGNEWGVFHVRDKKLGGHRRERKSVFDADEQMREERVKQPPWFFHCLSLNMT